MHIWSIKVSMFDRQFLLTSPALNGMAEGYTGQNPQVWNIPPYSSLSETRVWCIMLHVFSLILHISLVKKSTKLVRQWVSHAYTNFVMLLEILVVISIRITVSANFSANSPLAAARPPQSKKLLIINNCVRLP